MIQRVSSFMLLIFSLPLFASADHCALPAPVPTRTQEQAQKRFELDSTLHPTWLYHIASINGNDQQIKLDNGSKWSTFSWYKSRINQWEPGDQVTVDYYFDTHFLDVRIKNYTKQSYAWFTLKEDPQPQAPRFLYIEKIPNKMSIVLNDGTLIQAKTSWMLNLFQEGDIVIPLYGKGVGGTSSPYSLWDINARKIAFDLIVNAP